MAVIGDYFSFSMALRFYRLQEEVFMFTVQQETPIMCLMTGQHFLTIWLSQLLPCREALASS